MGTQIFSNKKRYVTILSTPLRSMDITTKPVAVLLPAYNDSNLYFAVEIAEKLVTSGCLELCCVGPKSELLHDTLDDIVERLYLLDVVTTFDRDETDACEYFVHAANGSSGDLLAFIEPYSSLSSILKKELADYGYYCLN